MSIRRCNSRRTMLAELLQELRLAAGLRQVDVAQRLGVPQSFVSKYESGERVLTIIELEQVCDALNADLVDLVRRYRNGKS